MEIYKWLSDHWVELLAYMGVSGAAGVSGVKFIDRDQNRRIKELELNMGVNNAALKDHNDRLIRMEKDLEKNVAFDKQLREDLNNTLSQLNSRLDRIETLLMNINSR